MIVKPYRFWGLWQDPIDSRYCANNIHKKWSRLDEEQCLSRSACYTEWLNYLLNPELEYNFQSKILPVHQLTEWKFLTGKIKAHASLLHGSFLLSVSLRTATELHMLHRNCLLSHVIEGNIEGKERQWRRRNLLLDVVLTETNEKTLETERGCTIPHSLEEQLFKLLRTCHKTDCVVVTY